MRGRRRSKLSYLPPGPRRTPSLIYILLAAALLASLYYLKQNMVKDVNGTIFDDYSGQPIPNAVITLNNDPKLAHVASIAAEVSLKTDAQGHFVFPQATQNYSLKIEAINYHPIALPPASQSYTVTARLKPTLLRGIVKDEQGNPVARAAVTLNGQTITTGSEGDYQFLEPPETGQLTVKANGYQRTTVKFDKTMRQDVALKSFRAKGIYLAAINAADKDFLPNILNLVDTTELNTVVVDVKDESGKVAFDSRLPLAKTLPDGKGRIGNLADFVKTLHAHNVYAVARFVVFLDPLLTDEKPEWALKSRSSGKPWADAANYNWSNPYNTQVVDYNLGLVKEVAEAGFDEIQFDYLRFPALGTLTDIDYGRTSDDKSRVEAVSNFLKRSREMLTPYGVATSITIFGLATLEADDLGVGTKLDALADLVDYISPTLYPSSWGKGTFGFDQPVTRPYDVIYNSLISAKAILQGKTGLLRPWLQDFSISGVNYSAKEVRDQIRATDQSEAAVTGGWLLWNFNSRYSAQALDAKPNSEVGAINFQPE